MPKRKKKQLVPPDTTVAEDDQAVNTYNEAVAAEAQTERCAAVQGANRGSSKEQYLAQMTADVKAVITNIERGDSPMQMARAWVWCSADDWKGGSGGIQILTEYDQDALMLNWDGTEDCETLKFLFEAGVMREAAAKLGIDVVEDAGTQISGAAIDSAIDMVVAAGILDNAGDGAWIVPGDAENLKRKFKVWLSGVTWGKTYVSSTNRASLASWQGDPWSKEHIMTYRGCGLLSELSPTSPLVVRWGGLEGDTPERIEASTASQTGVNTVKASSFILIWTNSEEVLQDGNNANPKLCLDVEVAIKATRTVYYEDFHALLTKQDGKKKTGPLDKFLVKSI
jgi:hypothetical protein